VQFQINGAYLSALRHNWLDEICSHMKRPINHNKKWFKEDCKNEALKYNTRTDFFNNAIGAYKAAYKNNWLEEICCHMTSIKKPNNYWTKNLVHSEALKYSSKLDFIKNSKSAYIAASKNNWIDEVCGHMESCGNVLSRCVYVYEFPDNFVYVGLTCNEKRRQIEHLQKLKSPVYLHIIKTNCQPKYKLISNNYIDVIQAQQLEKQTYEIYKNNGWFLLNSNRTGGIGSQKLPQNRKIK
jgi:predicted GIY-YIG superfamily endonuclease